MSQGGSSTHASSTRGGGSGVTGSGSFIMRSRLLTTNLFVVGKACNSGSGYGARVHGFGYAVEMMQFLAFCYNPYVEGHYGSQAFVYAAGLFPWWDLNFASSLPVGGFLALFWIVSTVVLANTLVWVVGAYRPHFTSATVVMGHLKLKHVMDLTVKVFFVPFMLTLLAVTVCDRALYIPTTLSVFANSDIELVDTTSVLDDDYSSLSGKKGASSSFLGSSSAASTTSRASSGGAGSSPTTSNSILSVINAKSDSHFLRSPRRHPVLFFLPSETCGWGTVTVTDTRIDAAGSSAGYGSSTSGTVAGDSSQKETTTDASVPTTTIDYGGANNLMLAHKIIGIIFAVCLSLATYVRLCFIATAELQPLMAFEKGNNCGVMAALLAKISLVVAFVMLLSGGHVGMYSFVVSLVMFALAATHVIFVPYLDTSVHRGTVGLFCVFGWLSLSSFTASLTRTGSVENEPSFVSFGGLYVMMILGGLAIGYFTSYYVAMIRFCAKTQYLLEHVLKPGFVRPNENPFFVACYNRDPDSLPYPRWLPETDYLFSPYRYLEGEIADEGLGAEDRVHQQMTMEGRGGWQEREFAAARRRAAAARGGFMYGGGGGGGGGGGSLSGVGPVTSGVGGVGMTSPHLGRSSMSIGGAPTAASLSAGGGGDSGQSYFDRLMAMGDGGGADANSPDGDDWLGYGYGGYYYDRYVEDDDGFGSSFRRRSAVGLGSSDAFLSPRSRKSKRQAIGGWGGDASTVMGAASTRGNTRHQNNATNRNGGNKNESTTKGDSNSGNNNNTNNNNNDASAAKKSNRRLRPEDDPMGPYGAYSSHPLYHHASRKAMLKSALRVQVVSATLDSALTPYDAEISVRFLYEWNKITGRRPTPHMLSFACRIFAKFLMKFPNSAVVHLSFVRFITTFAPSRPRMRLCAQILESTPSKISSFILLPELYEFFLLSLSVCDTLGERDRIHLQLYHMVRAQHKKALVHAAAFWRSLLEDVVLLKASTATSEPESLSSATDETAKNNEKKANLSDKKGVAASSSSKPKRKEERSAEEDRDARSSKDAEKSNNDKKMMTKQDSQSAVRSASSINLSLKSRKYLSSTANILADNALISLCHFSDRLSTQRERSFEKYLSTLSVAADDELLYMSFAEFSRDVLYNRECADICTAESHHVAYQKRKRLLEGVTGFGSGLVDTAVGGTFEGGSVFGLSSTHKFGDAFDVPNNAGSGGRQRPGSGDSSGSGGSSAHLTPTKSDQTTVQYPQGAINNNNTNTTNTTSSSGGGDYYGSKSSNSKTNTPNLRFQDGGRGGGGPLTPPFHSYQQNTLPPTAYHGTTPAMGAGVGGYFDGDTMSRAASFAGTDIDGHGWGGNQLGGGDLYGNQQPSSFGGRRASVSSSYFSRPQSQGQSYFSAAHTGNSTTLVGSQREAWVGAALPLIRSSLAEQRERLASHVKANSLWITVFGVLVALVIMVVIDAAVVITQIQAQIMNAQRLHSLGELRTLTQTIPARLQQAIDVIESGDGAGGTVGGLYNYRTAEFEYRFEAFSAEVKSFISVNARLLNAEGSSGVGTLASLFEEPIAFFKTVGFGGVGIAGTTSSSSPDATNSDAKSASRKFIFSEVPLSSQAPPLDALYTSVNIVETAVLISAAANNAIDLLFQAPMPSKQAILADASVQFVLNEMATTASIAYDTLIQRLLTNGKAGVGAAQVAISIVFALTLFVLLLCYCAITLEFRKGATHKDKVLSLFYLIPPDTLAMLAEEARQKTEAFIFTTAVVNSASSSGQGIVDVASLIEGRGGGRPSSGFGSDSSTAGRAAGGLGEVGGAAPNNTMMFGQFDYIRDTTPAISAGGGAYAPSPSQLAERVPPSSPTNPAGVVADQTFRIGGNIATFPVLPLGESYSKLEAEGGGRVTHSPAGGSDEQNSQNMLNDTQHFLSPANAMNPFGAEAAKLIATANSTGIGITMLRLQQQMARAGGGGGGAGGDFMGSLSVSGGGGGGGSSSYIMNIINGGGAGVLGLGGAGGSALLKHMGSSVQQGGAPPLGAVSLGDFKVSTAGPPSSLLAAAADKRKLAGASPLGLSASDMAALARISPSTGALLGSSGLSSDSNSMRLVRSSSGFLSPTASNAYSSALLTRLLDKDLAERHKEGAEAEGGGKASPSTTAQGRTRSKTSGGGGGEGDAASLPPLGKGSGREKRPASANPFVPPSSVSASTAAVLSSTQPLSNSFTTSYAAHTRQQQQQQRIDAANAAEAVSDQHLLLLHQRQEQHHKRQTPPHEDEDGNQTKYGTAAAAAATATVPKRKERLPSTSFSVAGSSNMPAVAFMGRGGGGGEGDIGVGEVQSSKVGLSHVNQEEAAEEAPPTAAVASNNRAAARFGLAISTTTNTKDNNNNVGGIPSPPTTPGGRGGRGGTLVFLDEDEDDDDKASEDSSGEDDGDADNAEEEQEEYESGNNNNDDPSNGLGMQDQAARVLHHQHVPPSALKKKQQKADEKTPPLSLKEGVTTATVSDGGAVAPSRKDVLFFGSYTPSVVLPPTAAHRQQFKADARRAAAAPSTTAERRSTSKRRNQHKDEESRGDSGGGGPKKPSSPSPSPSFSLSSSFFFYSSKWSAFLGQLGPSIFSLTSASILRDAKGVHIATLMIFCCIAAAGFTAAAQHYSSYNARVEPVDKIEDGIGCVYRLALLTDKWVSATGDFVGSAKFEKYRQAVENLDRWRSARWCIEWELSVLHEPDAAKAAKGKLPKGGGSEPSSLTSAQPMTTSYVTAKAASFTASSSTTTSTTRFASSTSSVLAGDYFLFSDMIERAALISTYLATHVAGLGQVLAPEVGGFRYIRPNKTSVLSSHYDRFVETISESHAKMIVDKDGVGGLLEGSNMSSSVEQVGRSHSEDERIDREIDAAIAKSSGSQKWVAYDSDVSDSAKDRSLQWNIAIQTAMDVYFSADYFYYRSVLRELLHQVVVTHAEALGGYVRSEQAQIAVALVAYSILGAGVLVGCLLFLGRLARCAYQHRIAYLEERKGSGSSSPFFSTSDARGDGTYSNSTTTEEFFSEAYGWEAAFLSEDEGSGGKRNSATRWNFLSARESASGGETLNLKKKKPQKGAKGTAEESSTTTHVFVAFGGLGAIWRKRGVGAVVLFCTAIVVGCVVTVYSAANLFSRGIVLRDASHEAYAQLDLFNGIHTLESLVRNARMFVQTFEHPTANLLDFILISASSISDTGVSDVAGEDFLSSTSAATPQHYSNRYGATESYASAFLKSPRGIGSLSELEAGGLHKSTHVNERNGPLGKGAGRRQLDSVSIRPDLPVGTDASFTPKSFLNNNQYSSTGGDNEFLFSSSFSASGSSFYSSSSTGSSSSSDLYAEYTRYLSTSAEVKRISTIAVMLAASAIIDNSTWYTEAADAWWGSNGTSWRTQANRTKTSSPSSLLDSAPLGAGGGSGSAKTAPPTLRNDLAPSVVQLVASMYGAAFSIGNISTSFVDNVLSTLASRARAAAVVAAVCNDSVTYPNNSATTNCSKTAGLPYPSTFIFSSFKYNVRDEPTYTEDLLAYLSDYSASPTSSAAASFASGGGVGFYTNSTFDLMSGLRSPRERLALANNIISSRRFLNLVEASRSFASTEATRLFSGAIKVMRPAKEHHSEAAKAFFIAATVTFAISAVFVMLLCVGYVSSFSTTGRQRVVFRETYREPIVRISLGLSAIGAISIAVLAVCLVMASQTYVSQQHVSIAHRYEWSLFAARRAGQLMAVGEVANATMTSAKAQTTLGISLQQMQAAEHNVYFHPSISRSLKSSIRSELVFGPSTEQRVDLKGLLNAYMNDPDGTLTASGSVPPIVGNGGAGGQQYDFSSSSSAIGFAVRDVTQLSGGSMLSIVSSQSKGIATREETSPLGVCFPSERADYEGNQVGLGIQSRKLRSNFIALSSSSISVSSYAMAQLSNAASKSGVGVAKSVDDGSLGFGATNGESLITPELYDLTSSSIQNSETARRTTNAVRALMLEFINKIHNASSNFLRGRLTVVIVMLTVLGATILAVFLFILLPTSQKLIRGDVGVRALILQLPKSVTTMVPEISDFFEYDATNKEDLLKKKLQQSEKLLQSILPPMISRRLKNGETAIADTHPKVSVVFAALVGLDVYTATLGPRGFVAFLNSLMVTLDRLVDTLLLEKIKTIGDIYFLCGGLTKKTSKDHAVRCVECSLFFMEALYEHNVRHRTPLLCFRIGVNTGPAVAGVIGSKKVAFDLWGDSVNTASRMQSTAKPGEVQISRSTYLQVKDRYVVVQRSVVAKGKGTMDTYVVVDRSTPSLSGGVSVSLGGASGGEASAVPWQSAGPL